MAKRNKFFAKKVKNEYGVFDSTSEFNHYLYLLDLEKKGEIYNLRRQVEFEILPNQYKEVEVRLKTKIKTVKKLIERKCCYTADFVYEDSDGKTVVVDVKSKYTIKEKETLRYLIYVAFKSILHK